MSHIHGLTRNREEKVVYSDDIIEEVRGRSVSAVEREEMFFLLS